MGVTLQFIPYTEIEDLSSLGRIRKLLTIAKNNKIVLLEGRLRKEEEVELIKTTMEEINDDFRGIEMAVIYPGEDTEDMLKKLKFGFINILIGNRLGITILGPASIVKEIKKDPKRIQLVTEDDGTTKVHLKEKQKRNNHSANKAKNSKKRR